MKHIFTSVSIFLFLLFSAFFCYSQTATTTINYTGGLAQGGCEVCGTDYWVINNPPAPYGGKIGTSDWCVARTFFDPVPAGNTVTSVTARFWTASCYGAAMFGTINSFALPVAYNGNGDCPCSSNPCAMTTSVTGNYPCGLPGYVYGGTNIFNLCASAPLAFSKIEFIFTYYPTEVIIPTITPSGPLTFCQGGSVTLNAGAGYSEYHWSNGATTQSTTVSTSGTYSVTVTGVTGCTENSASVVVTVNPPPANDNCANAINIPSLPYTSAIVDNTCATDDVPTSSCVGPYHNVWWKVTGVCGTMTALTCTGNTNFDDEIAVFTGSCGSMTQVACNDNNGAGCSSNYAGVTWNSTAGTVYYISVGSYSSSSGTGNLQLNVTSNYTSSVAPTLATSSPATVCSGVPTTITLTASGGTLGTGGVVQWYRGSCGGTMVGTGNPLTISHTQTSATTYYVRYSDFCNTTGCTSVTVY